MKGGAAMPTLNITRLKASQTHNHCMILGSVAGAKDQLHLHHQVMEERLQKLYGSSSSTAMPAATLKEGLHDGFSYSTTSPTAGTPWWQAATLKGVYREDPFDYLPKSFVYPLQKDALLERMERNRCAGNGDDNGEKGQCLYIVKDPTGRSIYMPTYIYTCVYICYASIYVCLHLSIYLYLYIVYLFVHSC
jgi:hypothetical protein